MRNPIVRNLIAWPYTMQSMGLPGDDFELLRRYARERDEAAFAELMRRHVDLIHSAARRRVGDRALADDVTQATFMILARKAKSVRQRRQEPLSAWLLNAVRYAAANAIKMERRRRKHEHAAASRTGHSGACSADPTQVIVWQEISQQLDDAVLKLSASHRRAVLLRYFENRPIAEMAAQLQVSEGAVKQLLNRAIDKLRHSLSKRGATASAIDSMVLARLLESQVVTSAPATVKAACAAAGSAAAGSIGVGTGTSIAKGAIKMMAWTKAQVAAGVVIAAAVCGTGGTLAIHSALAQAQANPGSNNPPNARNRATMQLDKAANNGIVSVETAPPVIVKTVPASGATDVNAATTTELKVTFSKDMEPGNFSWVQFGKDTFPATTAKPRFLDDHRTCVLPVKLEPGHPYVVWLNNPPYNSFMDKEGKRAVPYLLVFETKP